MASDLLGYGLGSQALRSLLGGDHEAGSPADQRGEDDVCVSDDCGR